MSPSFSVPTSEQPTSAGLPTGTGTAFVAGVFDQGPPIGNTTGYAKCGGLADVIAAFGPRSSTNSATWDWLDEFFNEGGVTGKVAYVTRATDGTATTASLTLNDGAASPAATGLVTAGSAGTEGNYLQTTIVASSAATFSGTLTSSSASVTSVTAGAFSRIGVGTPISGTGVPANCYVSAVNAGAGTLTLSANATASGVKTLTPGQITVTITENDSLGNQVSSEVHGPFTTLPQLVAASSSLVVFADSGSSSGNLPAALTVTSLSGGANASDLTDASHVSALSVFSPLLGAGSVALPGLTSTTAWAGIQAHANANNRWGILDLADNTNSNTIKGTVQGALSGDTSRLLWVQGSVTIPASTNGAVRTVAGSAAVAALRAQVANGNNQAIVPAGVKWGLTYATGFTTFFGEEGCFQQADVDALESVGVNVFANIVGVNCLWGFVSPDINDLIYDQANAATARMDVVAATEAEILPFLFDLIDLNTLTALQAGVSGKMLTKYTAGEFYDGGSGQPGDAFTVTTADPVNTPATAAAKKLTAEVKCRFPRYADNVVAPLAVIPVTVSL